MTGAGRADGDRPGPGPLDVVSAAFGRVLRAEGVRSSPAEVIEVRRVLAMLGAADLGALRAGLRAVSVKYEHERAGFERAFTAFFVDGPRAAAERSTEIGMLQPGSEGLPAELELAEDDDPLGRFADYNPRAAEVGDLVDAPENDKGFNPHRDDDDLSMASGDSDLAVSSGEDQGRRGVTYTVDLERAGSAVAKELSTGQSAPVAGSVDWDDPATILAWLSAYDPRAIYGGETPDLDALTPMQLNRLVEAITDFVAALAQRGTRPVEAPDAAPGPDPADLQRACHELLRRMRGAPRRVPREHSRGPLDVRHTVRASMRTDGVPFHLVVRRKVPDRVRLLVVADVSLSVRSVTGFALRLAQMLHGMAFRCRVLAYVDSPVDVTDTLLRTDGDGALAAVLADPRLDLDATSDYGKVLAALNGEHAGLVDKRTAVLFVGDGRTNGLPAGEEDLRRLARRAHRVGWITPEARRYWNQASCAMPAYAEIVDHVTVARDPADLVERVGELGHALS